MIGRGTEERKKRVVYFTIMYCKHSGINNADPPLLCRSGCFMKGYIYKSDKLFNPLVVFGHFRPKNVTL